VSAADDDDDVGISAAVGGDAGGISPARCHTEQFFHNRKRSSGVSVSQALAGKVAVKVRGKKREKSIKPTRVFKTTSAEEPSKTCQTAPVFFTHIITMMLIINRRSSRRTSM
jgi:hypothetical protein